MVNTIELIDSYARDLIWFQNNFLEIQSKFEGKIIAVKDKKVIGYSGNLKKLLKDLQEKGVDYSEILIKTIPSKGQITVL